MSPMQLSLRELRRTGWTADIVERRVPGRYVTHDFLGLVDIIAVRGAETIGVQATSSSNVAAHVRKLNGSPHLSVVLGAGWQVVVWGWRKKDGRWICRSVLCEPVAMCNDVRHATTDHEQEEEAPVGSPAHYST
jgi:hypothetical protein